MRPVICLITDGRLAAGGDGTALVETVAVAARAGVDLIQIRERRLDDRALAELVRCCVGVTRGTRARLVVNDRLDVALAAGAHGVHLRHDSFPARRVQALAPAQFLVGRSVHSVEEATRAAEGNAVDYLMFGTVFATLSKPGRVPAGLAALADAVRATPMPTIAVGGVTADNAALIAQTGAAGVAGIGLFGADARDAPSLTVMRITRAFDTPRSGS
jgi:thiamine-phosphate pyrophosphorylase